MSLKLYKYTVFFSSMWFSWSYIKYLTSIFIFLFAFWKKRIYETMFIFFPLMFYSLFQNKLIDLKNFAQVNLIWFFCANVTRKLGSVLTRKQNQNYSKNSVEILKMLFENKLLRCDWEVHLFSNWISQFVVFNYVAWRTLKLVCRLKL